MLFVSAVSHHHLSTEALEEQVQIHRGGAADKEGEKRSSGSFSLLLCMFIRYLTGVPCLIGFSLTKIPPRQTGAGESEGEQRMHVHEF